MQSSQWRLRYPAKLQILFKTMPFEFDPEIDAALQALFGEREHELPRLPGSQQFDQQNI